MGRSFIISITLRVIHSSGQAELVERCLHVFQCPAVSRCVRPDVLYRDGGERLVRQQHIFFHSINSVYIIGNAIGRINANDVPTLPLWVMALIAPPIPTPMHPLTSVKPKLLSGFSFTETK